MKKRSWSTLAPAFALAVFFAAGAVSCDSRAGGESAGQGRAGAELGVQGLIVTSQPVMSEFTLRVPWIGLVQSQSSVTLTALASGKVDAIKAKDEMPVAEGATVIELGGAQVESKHSALQAAVDSLASEASLATQKVERLQQNLEEQLTTKDELAAAQESQIRLTNQLRDARLALESFEKQTRITAPMAGVFTKRRVSAGQTVNAGDVVGEVMNPRHLRITASLFPPEGIELGGRQAVIRLAENQTVAGTISRVLPEASETGATRVWIEGSEIDQRLRPGETAAGEVIAETRSSLAVPRSAVVYGPDEQPYVFVQRNGEYERRGVNLGLTEGDRVEVLAGLEEGQSVVTKGAYELFYQSFSRQFRVKD